MESDREGILRTRPEGLVNRQQLAEHFCCTPSAIDAWRRRGLPTVFVGRLVRFRISRVERWFEVLAEERLAATTPQVRESAQAQPPQPVRGSFLS